MHFGADLKRFSETRWSKLTNIVEFPTGEHGLDMAPYAASGTSSAKYTLYGISNHMGKRIKQAAFLREKNPLDFIDYFLSVCRFHGRWSLCGALQASDHQKVARVQRQYVSVYHPPATGIRCRLTDALMCNVISFTVLAMPARVNWCHPVPIYCSTNERKRLKIVHSHKTPRHNTK